MKIRAHGSWKMSKNEAQKDKSMKNMKKTKYIENTVKSSTILVTVVPERMS